VTTARADILPTRPGLCVLSGWIGSHGVSLVVSFLFLFLFLFTSTIYRGRISRDAGADRPWLVIKCDWWAGFGLLALIALCNCLNGFGGG